MSSKPKKWTWQEWCNQSPLDYGASPIQLTDKQLNAVVDLFKRTFRANEPYIEWLEWLDKQKDIHIKKLEKKVEHLEGLRKQKNDRIEVLLKDGEALHATIDKNYDDIEMLKKRLSEYESEEAQDLLDNLKLSIFELVEKYAEIDRELGDSYKESNRAVRKLEARIEKLRAALKEMVRQDKELGWDSNLAREALAEDDKHEM